MENDAAPDIETHEVDAARWGDFERLFEARGAPKYCWCMVWRRDENGQSPQGGPARKEAMRRKVAAGGRVGILAYLDGEPSAWCSVAPRASFVRVGGVRPPGEDESRVWSVSCFYVPRRLRRNGLMERLIDAAVSYAGPTARPSSRRTRSRRTPQVTVSADSFPCSPRMASRRRAKPERAAA